MPRWEGGCGVKPILGIRSLTRALHNTSKWAFFFGGGSRTAHFNNLKKKLQTHLLKIMSFQAKIWNTFLPTRPPGPSWSSSCNVRLFIYVFVPFPCNFFAWSDWCRACLVRGLVRSRSRSQSRVEP